MRVRFSGLSYQREPLGAVLTGGASKFTLALATTQHDNVTLALF